MALPFTQVFAAILDEPDIPEWSAPSFTHERPPHLNEHAIRCPHCGCDCGCTRAGSDTASSATAVDHDWEMIDSIHAQSDNATEHSDADVLDEAEHDAFSAIPSLCFSQDYSCVARGITDLTDSTEALASASSVCTTFSSPTPSPSASSIWTTTSDSCIAECDSAARALADSGILRFTTGAIVLDDTPYIRAAPTTIDDY